STSPTSSSRPPGALVRHCSASKTTGTLSSDGHSNRRRAWLMSSPRLPRHKSDPRSDTKMKLCRYDDDRLGVVIGDQVHDVTQAQTAIRNSTPYAAKVDPVLAALPKWRDKLEQAAKSAPGKPI